MCNKLHEISRKHYLLDIPCINIFAEYLGLVQKKILKIKSSVVLNLQNTIHLAKLEEANMDLLNQKNWNGKLISPFVINTLQSSSDNKCVNL